MRIKEQNEEEQARLKMKTEATVDNSLGKEYTERNGDWYVSSEGDHAIRIESIAGIRTLGDLEDLIPIIEADE